MKYTFFSNLSLFCFVQLLCIRFHKMLHFTFQFLYFLSYIPCLPPPCFPSCLPSPPPFSSLFCTPSVYSPTYLPIYHNRHSPPTSPFALPSSPMFMGGVFLQFGGAGVYDIHLPSLPLLIYPPPPPHSSTLPPFAERGREKRGEGGTPV